MAPINAPTQEDPGVLVQSQEVEELLQPLPIPSSEEESDNSTREPSKEKQEVGPVDHSHSPCSVESLPWEDSRRGFV